MGSRPERALAALYDFNGRSRPLVTYAFLTLCLLATVPILLRPELYRVFGGIQPRQNWWQPFTAAFVHGWPGFPGWIHLALNALLILECGRACERLLGGRRFLVLGTLSLGANALVLSLTEGTNGSSLVIWSWGPALFVALRWAKDREEDVTESPAYIRVRGVLLVMYVLITLVMALLPYLYGWRGNPLVSLLRGNLFHLVATVVGTGFALVCTRFVQQRMMYLAQP